LDEIIIIEKVSVFSASTVALTTPVMITHYLNSNRSTSKYQLNEDSTNPYYILYQQIQKENEELKAQQRSNNYSSRRIRNSKCHRCEREGHF